MDLAPELPEIAQNALGEKLQRSEIIKYVLFLVEIYCLHTCYLEHSDLFQKVCSHATIAKTLGDHAQVKFCFIIWLTPTALVSVSRPFTDLVSHTLYRRNTVPPMSFVLLVPALVVLNGQEGWINSIIQLRQVLASLVPRPGREIKYTSKWLG